jgi:NAD(P)-dependent dehydrogenase (short-subunit alcohol dehydrogenase family)
VTKIKFWLQTATKRSFCVPFDHSTEDIMPHPAIRASGVAVVTGAAYGGIGYAFVHRLATQYKMRVVLADISKEHLATAEKKLQEAGVSKDDLLCVTVDVSKADEMQSLADQVCEWRSLFGPPQSDHTKVSKFKQVDILHLNAGIAVRGGSKCWENRAAFDTVLGVNFYGVLNGIQAFVGRMIENRSKCVC